MYPGEGHGFYFGSATSAATVEKVMRDTATFLDRHLPLKARGGEAVKLLPFLLLVPLLHGGPPQSPLLRWGGYRGANINHQFTDEDARVLAGWGANIVRINFHQLNLMHKQPPHEINMEAVARVNT